MIGTHQAFRVADEQKTSWIQAIVVFIHEPALGFFVKIDHHVSTENDLESGAERKRLH